MPVLPDDRLPRVAVVGFGYVGSCLSAVLAGRGLEVVGVDTDETLVAEIGRGYCRFQEEGLAELIGRTTAAGLLRVTSDPAAVEGADVVVIAVGTPVRPDGSLADEQLREVCEELGGRLRPGTLVLLKSTVSPGTTRTVVAPLLEKGGLVAGRDFALAFTPERLAEGAALRELGTFPIVVGGFDEESTRTAAGFWERSLGVGTIVVDSLESAEIVKLADNWWIDLNIALANELAQFCDLFGADVMEVIGAANTIAKGGGSVNILTPGVGVGGSCLTKDPWMVWRAARERGVEIRTAPVGREVNSLMPGHTAGLIVEGLAALGRPAAGSRVAVLGLSFKSGSGDLRATPVLDTVRALTAAGAEVRTYDPLADRAAATAMFGIAPEESVAEAVRGADCVAVLARHPELAGLDFGELPLAGRALVLDGRDCFSAGEIAAVRGAGHVYRGIGRR
ncbi:nucleotide sugar dehydrogenase [Streptomyces sp. CAU 1734]|uniref:nucleotide sugar dehydrogenase n=1 Tax=Streptomyces sp. CAU 1734 TaxID=3140360 RepID=UPI0032618888